jgi:predicted nucleotidyltransferase
MDKDQALAVLRRHADTLRSRGVRHAALFGSLARGDAGPKSDIDILIELAPETSLDIFAYVELKNDIAALFPGRVDVVNKEALKPHLRPPTAAESIYAF